MEQAALGILDGIRILDVGAWIAGTGAGALLGNLGAEVIKIEDPVHGDNYRGMATQYGDAMSVKGRHIGFEMANLNKKGITLDLTSDLGQEVLHELVAKSDIFHTNHLQRVREKLRITYEDLRRHNPKLVYCLTTGFGTRGPMADKRAFDTLGQAQSGIMWAAGDREYDEPMGIVGAPLDQQGATVMALGMVLGLMGRDRLGIGQEVHVSMLGSAIHLQSLNANIALLRGRANGRFRRKSSPNPMSNHYRCADGKWIMLTEPQTAKYWPRFCEAMGISEIKNDPRFVDVNARSKNRAELIALLDRLFAAKSRDDWVRRFDSQGAPFGYAPILDMNEVVRSEQVLANDYVVDFDHGALGLVQMVGLPTWFSSTPGRIRREAPEHGQHTEEVLMDILGYSWEKLGDLREKGVI